MYGCKTCTPTSKSKRDLLFRQMLRLSWPAKKPNIEEIRDAETQRPLINIIHRRRAKFVGRVMRREGLEHLVTTGMLEGKRSRGRQRCTVLVGLSWVQTVRVTDKISATRNRNL
ncbi:retrovirus-related pol polyprotein line-1 [Plakobranchus ocellatus]|uniref:Retrovirus-related pol polyprotein line-1 n=1 Tax=Plakobranchus ocellatus TaxID=259542 RepID=A0AAV4BLB5_9GAST|nr:retrovirus-related pol polyprotein line-1 [Plakobranchus ocellatus]